MRTQNCRSDEESHRNEENEHLNYIRCSQIIHPSRCFGKPRKLFLDRFHSGRNFLRFWSSESPRPAGEDSERFGEIRETSESPEPAREAICEDLFSKLKKFEGI